LKLLLGGFLLADGADALISTLRLFVCRVLGGAADAVFGLDLAQPLVGKALGRTLLLMLDIQYRLVFND